MTSFANNSAGSFGNAGTTRQIEVSDIPLGASVEAVVDAQPYDWVYTEASITAPDGNTYVVWPDRTYTYNIQRLTRTVPISYPSVSTPNGIWSFFIRDTDNETSMLYGVQLNFTFDDPPEPPSDAAVQALAIFVDRGNTVDFRPETDVQAGAIVARGDLVGISKLAIRAGEFGALAVRGVFDVVKDPSTNIDAGTPLYWSDLSQHVVKTPAGHPLLGKAIHSAAIGTSSVRMLLTQ